MKLIDKDALVAEIKRLIELFTIPQYSCEYNDAKADGFREFLSFIDTLKVKEVDISSVSENLAEAKEYLDYTHTSNLAHNKPMVNARLKKAIRSLFDAGLFELTHDKKYRMENLGLKAQKGEKL